MTAQATSRSSDIPDGLHQRLLNSPPRTREIETGAETTAPADPNIEEYGPLFFVKDDSILAWMVEGAVNHLEELNESGDFTLSDKQRARVDDLLHESRSPEIFVAGRVIKKKDADLAVDELTHGYLDFCRAKGWEPFRTRQFENEVVDLMEKFHRVLRRNDLTRGAKWHRGFKHVTLKVEEAK